MEVYQLVEASYLENRRHSRALLRGTYKSVETFVKSFARFYVQFPRE
jgi:hypothetical protein